MRCHRLTSPLVSIIGGCLLIAISAIRGVSLTRPQASAAESITDLRGAYACPRGELKHPDGKAPLVQAAPPRTE